MRFVIQRVKNASVTVEENVTGEIGKGFLVLIGVSENDTEQTADKMIRKMTGLRIFEDENGKTNLSLADVNGSLLLVSQFTLYANCKKGNRPSFIEAGSPEKAEALYEYVIRECKKSVPEVQTGVFGADMKKIKLSRGLEPPTSALPRRRATDCAKTAYCVCFNTQALIYTTHSWIVKRKMQ